MIVSFFINRKVHKVNIAQPLDISIPLKFGKKGPSAWYINPSASRPVTIDQWVGSVKKGAPVNFNNLYFNPHAHTTHTESVGHITPNLVSVHQCFKKFFFLAEVISVAPEIKDDDLVISKQQLVYLLENKNPEALVIRTLPNEPSKKIRKYNYTNWPYLTQEAAFYLKNREILHLLIDTPSVDKEKDEGKLLAHKAFWDYPTNPRLNATITEFIYVNNKIKDGSYILNLQTANMVNDATPSRPVLYKLIL